MKNPFNLLQARRKDSQVFLGLKGLAVLGLGSNG